MPPPRNFHKNVFINCPFDRKYKPMLRAMLFTILYCGFEPRIATERADSHELRRKKIERLIKQSVYSIHDISRMKSQKKGDLARFNMPFELGLDLGCRVYGKDYLSKKSCLILDEKPYRYQKSLSDAAGVDVGFHGSDPEELVRQVRDWISITSKKKRIEGPTLLWQRFNEFYSHFHKAAKDAGWSERDIEKMPDIEFISYIRDWIKIQAKSKK